MPPKLGVAMLNLARLTPTAFSISQYSRRSISSLSHSNACAHPGRVAIDHGSNFKTESHQTPEANAFITRILSLPANPGISLDAALQPSLDNEAELRRLFATDKNNARLSDPYVGLVNVFSAPAEIRTTRERIIIDEVDLSAKYVMPLSSDKRRKEGAPSMADDIEEFKKNWSIFSEGSLSQLLDWNNVVVAGGSVLACLLPVPEDSKVSKRAMRKYYHSAAYPTSDIDIFLWGLTPEQAEKKIVTIYEAVRDSVPWDVTCVRTKHTVSIHSQYPYRSIQIVLRLYKSPAEILAGFDIDAPCTAYDGQHVWANPRAIIALMRQCNTMDVTRRSPSYEVRLAKYSARGFEVLVPTLQRDRIDPTIYERSVARMEGLARLLVLEKLIDSDARLEFLDFRRNLRGRPNSSRRYSRPKRYKGDLKAKTSIGGLEMNDYDTASLHIPYGPGWDARRIDKLIYQTDLGMNSTFNPKNKGRRLHRHLAFFGNIGECLEDCCELCPTPMNKEEEKLQEEEDKQYIRGRIAFIEEDPGRQTLSGSFNPIDTGEWSEQAYLKPIQKFFSAIAENDRSTVQTMVKEGIPVNDRDHVGRTSLHVAIMSNATEIACDLIEAGARITARLVDGKGPLHLAAQNGQINVVRKLLERSVINEEQLKKIKENEGKNQDVNDVESEAVDRASENDQGLEVEGSKQVGKVNDGPATSGDMVEDEDNEEPDILDVNLPDWDLGFTPLCYSVLYASIDVINALIASGAEVKAPTKENAYNAIPLHPLTFTTLIEDEDRACKVAETLLRAGATSSTADEHLMTIFHSAVCAGKVKLVSTILRCDPAASTVLNFPSLRPTEVIFPLATAIARRDYSMLAALLAYGAKVTFSADDITRAQQSSSTDISLGYGIKDVLHQTYSPAETAIANSDDVVQLLLALGTPINIGTKESHSYYSDIKSRRTLYDWVRYGIAQFTQDIIALQTPKKNQVNNETISATGWMGYLLRLKKLQGEIINERDLKNQDTTDVKIAKLESAKAYLVDVERLLSAKGSKTWSKVYPNVKSTALKALKKTRTISPSKEVSTEPTFSFLNTYGGSFVPAHQLKSYEALFEACFTGDNDKIEELCLPPENGVAKHDSQLLNIHVQMNIADSQYSSDGYTPLVAAMAGRHWSSANLIFAIAVAQYHPGKVEEIKFEPSSTSLEDDVECLDEDDPDDEDFEMAASQSEVKFVDVANRPSGIRTDIHPRRMLCEKTMSWVQEDPASKIRSIKYGNLIEKSVSENDLEAFVTIAALYQRLPGTTGVPQTLLKDILAADRPEILDEFIRRTGHGINLKLKQEDGEVPVVVKDKSRAYLGLNVHGKKRSDLAHANDPNSRRTIQPVVPMLWKAAMFGARRVVEYLATERPLIAYRFYASSHSEDERAEMLRRSSNLEKHLPEWLGWTVNALGESPLSAAILGNKLDIMKVLAKLSPGLVTTSLRERIKFIGFNPLMLAVHRNCDTALVDFLLSRSVPPSDTDKPRDWNIYHSLCANNYCGLLEYLLKKLPRDINEALLSHQSKTKYETPLHVAVSAGSIRAVELILDYSKPKIVRDAEGSTVLHTAVQSNFAEITKRLLAGGLTEALFIENGVGRTVYDMVILQDLVNRVKSFSRSRTINIDKLSDYTKITGSRRFDVEDLESKLLQLRPTIESLVQAGKLRDQSQLTLELNAFVALMETRLKEAKATETLIQAKEELEQDKKDVTDTENIEETFKLITKAFSAVSKGRELIQLFDVQRSVQNSLAVSNRKVEVAVSVDDDGLAPEKQEEEQERKESLIFQHVHIM